MKKNSWKKIDCRNVEKNIEDSSLRLATSSKRRSSPFKKTNDITTLCGEEIAINAFFLGVNPFSFHKPSNDKVIIQFQKKYEKMCIKCQIVGK